MREKDNIQMICKDCADKQKNTTQDILKKEPLQVGDFVKISVGSGKTIEHMWFNVLEISGQRFYGVLDNYPCYKQEMTLGDKAWFDFNQIEDIISSAGIVSKGKTNFFVGTAEEFLKRKVKHHG